MLATSRAGELALERRFITKNLTLVRHKAHLGDSNAVSLHELTVVELTNVVGGEDRLDMGEAMVAHVGFDVGVEPLDAHGA